MIEEYVAVPGVRGRVALDLLKCDDEVKGIIEREGLGDLESFAGIDDEQEILNLSPIESWILTRARGSRRLTPREYWTARIWAEENKDKNKQAEALYNSMTQKDLNEIVEGVVNNFSGKEMDLIFNPIYFKEQRLWQRKENTGEKYKVVLPRVPKDTESSKQKICFNYQDINEFGFPTRHIENGEFSLSSEASGYPVNEIAIIIGDGKDIDLGFSIYDKCANHEMIFGPFYFQVREVRE